MGGIVTEEQAISRAQYLDLVYSQFGTLYDLIHHSPWPTTDPSRPVTEPPIDGIVGSVQRQTTEKYSKKKYQTATPSNQTTPSSKNAPESSGRKKKGKNKSKKHDNQQEGNKA